MIPESAEETVTVATVGGRTILDAAVAHQAVFEEVLGQLSGFGVTEEDDIAEAELDAGRQADGSLHLAGSLEGEEARAGRPDGERQAIGTGGARGDVAAA